MKSDFRDDQGKWITRFWWGMFWAVSLFDIAMVLLMFFLPNYAALWALLLVAGTAIGAAYYKTNKHPTTL